MINRKLIFVAPFSFCRFVFAKAGQLAVAMAVYNAAGSVAQIKIWPKILWYTQYLVPKRRTRRIMGLENTRNKPRS